ncbi:unnamed protein product [Calicophoron daubneyi]|uniref:Tumor susceptibility gene 101 protein n=1 Tax=Calicophoron daubneyi TaxID=300641 RepID=A0AAV2TDJ6_CALDB
MIACDNFLNDNLSKYKYASTVRDDVKSTLSAYKELRPKLEPFVFNDGSSRDLVCLEGTIPVIYQDATYNIPIAVFLYETHPHAAPMVYVRPTSTMQIKANDFVDKTGLVRLPYISEWKHPGSDLAGLLAVLQVVFGEKCPVFSKAVATPSVNHSSSYPSNTSMQRGGVNMYAQPPMGTMDGMPNSTYYMPQAPGVGWAMPQLPTTVGIPMPPPSAFNSPFSEQPLTSGGSGVGFVPSSTDGFNQNVVSQDHFRLSLRSAVLDKIRRVQREMLLQHQDELQSLRQTQADLRRGGEILQDMITRMDSERIRASEALESLKVRNNELTDLVTRLSAADKEPINVDEAVDTTAPLYRQLVSAFAEEQAIEDAIYFLGEALGKGAIEMEVFLKKVRELSRKQFLLRATVQQCRHKAGLPAC